MPTKTRKPRPASGSDTDRLTKLLAKRAAWRLLFLCEAGAMYDDQAAAELKISRDDLRQLRALAWRDGHDQFK